MSVDHIDWVEIRRLAVGLACRVSAAYGRPASLDFQDFVQIGLLAVLECAPRFDPSLGFAFRTFARHRIQGAMLDAAKVELRRPYLTSDGDADCVTLPTESSDLPEAIAGLPVYQQTVLLEHLAGTDLKRLARTRRRSYHHIRHTYLGAVALLRRRLTRRALVLPPSRRTPPASALRTASSA